MERNVGGLDRTARIVLGVLLGVVSIGVVVFGGGLSFQTLVFASAVALLLGAFLLVTAGTETCPVNSALGRNTYRGESRL